MSTTLLGFPARAVALVLLSLAACPLAALVAAGLHRPVVSRLGLRNARRRPLQATLLIGGLTLAASLIGASFTLRDSFNHSAHAARTAQIGSVDESVSGPFTTSQLRRAADRLHHSPSVTATASIYAGPATVQSDAAATQLTVLAVPASFQQAYGPTYSRAGDPVDLAQLQPHEVVLSATAAAVLDLHAGQHLRIEIAGVALGEAVKAVLDHDITLTSGETVSGLSFPEVVLPLTTLNTALQRAAGYRLTPNLLCVRNRLGAGGSRAVISELERLFGKRALLDPRATHATHIPTDFDTLLIHPLNPAVVATTGGPPLISSKGELIGSPAARQFFLLMPVFTTLLVGAGLLLLVLLTLLLAEERRAELGVSRAIGLQRRDLIRSLLVEGGVYAVSAATLAVPLAIGLVTLQLDVLSRLPTVGDRLASSQSAPLRLLRATPWTSLAAAWAIALLAILLVVGLCACWLSRLNVVAAMRDLDTPPHNRRAGRTARLTALVRMPGLVAIAATAASVALWALTEAAWVKQATILLALAAAALISIPVAARVMPRSLTRRLSLTLLGALWIVLGLQFGRPQFLATFAPNASTAGVGYLASSTPRTLLDLFAPIAGAVLVLVTNLDLIATAGTQALLHVPGARAISRLSLAFPVVQRRRSAFTISLLGLITFLVMLVVINNGSTVAQSGTRQTAGGFQLAIENVPATDHPLQQALAASPRTLGGKVAAAVETTPLYDLAQGRFTPISLPGRHTFGGPGPTVASDSFLELTTMPTFARASSFDTDRKVWDAVRSHPGDAVLQYQAGAGLPDANGFAPFHATIHQPHQPAITVTVIGLLPSNSYWPTLFLSQHTATAMHLRLAGYPRSYYLQVAHGASLAAARTDIGRTFHLGLHSLSVSAVDQASQNDYTATLTLFLSGYLALGLLFGAFAVGLITSRAAVERRQQIGMLRALGLQPRQIAAAFFTEASFVITLSLLFGTTLAWWIVRTVDHTLSNNVPVPVVPVALILIGSYTVALVCTVLPTRHAAVISPAEALRYE